MQYISSHIKMLVKERDWILEGSYHSSQLIRLKFRRWDFMNSFKTVGLSDLNSIIYKCLQAAAVNCFANRKVNSLSWKIEPVQKSQDPQDTYVLSYSFNLCPNNATNFYLREWKALTYAKREASVHLSLHAGAGIGLFNNIYNIAINWRGSQFPTAHNFLFSLLSFLYSTIKAAFILDAKHF